MLTARVQVLTEDDIPLNGAYMAPTISDCLSRIDCLCFFHGDTGHFYRPLYLELGARLAAQGIAFLSPHRRGHDIVANGIRDGALQGYAHESVVDSRLDYAAWLALLRAKGHMSIALAGWSPLRRAGRSGCSCSRKRRLAALCGADDTFPWSRRVVRILSQCGSQAMHRISPNSRSILRHDSPPSSLM